MNGMDEWQRKTNERMAGPPEPGSVAALTGEISSAWQTLEGHGFPPEACGWPFKSIVGQLPNAIDCAIDCLVRQREDLLTEVQGLRSAINWIKSNKGAHPENIVKVIEQFTANSPADRCGE